MLYYLKLTRESEWRIENVLYRQGKIVGGVYVGRGQEAIGVGAALTMRAGDVTFPCHRDFSVFLIRGFSLADIFANWLGRADSPNRGRDNTLHIGDMKLGIIPIISPLGATLPVACGVGMVLKQRGKGNVALVHFGEGTTSLGNVHEAMNFAAVMKLPVIFICNNNQYAYSTPVEKQFAVKSLAVRGPAYGMPGESVDGTDVLAVYDAVERASARARAGKGPSFLECVTHAHGRPFRSRRGRVRAGEIETGVGEERSHSAAREVSARQENSDRAADRRNRPAGPRGNRRCHRRRGGAASAAWRRSGGGRLLRAGLLVGETVRSGQLPSVRLVELSK